MLFVQVYNSILVETHRHSNICDFRMFCCFYIDKNNTFVMAVLKYVIGGATWLFAGTRHEQSLRDSFNA